MLFAVFAQFRYLRCLLGFLLFKHICSSCVSDLFYCYSVNTHRAIAFAFVSSTCQESKNTTSTSVTALAKFHGQKGFSLFLSF